MSVEDARFTDFDHLHVPATPNWALTVPPGRGRTGGRRLASPVFHTSSERIIQALARALETLPRTRILALEDDGRALEAECRSAVFRFVDRVSARAVPQAGGQSALWLFSRARIGYWDLGVNRRRVRTLLDAVHRLAEHDTPENHPAVEPEVEPD